MLNMAQINHIRDLGAAGYSVSKIHKLIGVDRKTIRKYLDMEDFSPEMPSRESRPSILDPLKPVIDGWLEEDKNNWYKQRHTAKRVFDRLRTEYGFDGSYSIVQRYVRSVRGRQLRQRASQELVWEPGTAQADFGEADFMENGMVVRKKYLVLSFPFSNAAIARYSAARLRSAPARAWKTSSIISGGVPRTIVFDNATGIGRKLCGIVHESALFAKFRAHHHFEARFCNPRSGWEKGNVERKVGYDRSNLFVPIQPFDDIEAYNRRLLGAHETKASELHYKKGIRISELFEQDRSALYPLPHSRFAVCRYEYLPADGYGKVRVDGEHYYSTRPEYAGRRDILVGIMAHYIDIYDTENCLLVRHRRQYGEGRTDLSDYSMTVSMLLHKPGSWRNSGVRLEMPDPLREYMDHLEKPELKSCPGLLDELSGRYGFYPAIDAMGRSIHGGRISACDAELICQRIVTYCIDTPPEEGPDLGEYDAAFLAQAQGGGAA